MEDLRIFHKSGAGEVMGPKDPEREAENEELRYLPDSEVEDEDLKAYKRFGVG